MSSHHGRNSVRLDGSREVVTTQTNVLAHDGVQARIVELDIYQLTGPIYHLGERDLRFAPGWASHEIQPQLQCSEGFAMLVYPITTAKDRGNTCSSSDQCG